MNKKRKKRPITLLEIMIVIFLIGIIGSVVGYNMKGSIDKGRAFKTERAIEQAQDILSLKVAEGFAIDDVIAEAAQFLQKSGLFKKEKDALNDGWGNKMDVHIEKGEIVVSSEAYENYKKKHEVKGKNN